MQAHSRVAFMPGESHALPGLSTTPLLAVFLDLLDDVGG